MLFGTFERFLLPAVLWSLLFKGFALWYAARRGEKGWFIALLVINILGLLEIFYLLFVAKIFTLQNDSPVSESGKSKKRMIKRLKDTSKE